jgi:hypothetical protein
MRWLVVVVATFAAAALAVGLCGCRSCDKVEAELRARESEARELRDHIEQCEFHNQALLRELCALRGMPGPAGVIETPTPPYPVCSLFLGRRTGGHPSDSLPADDALQVLLEPLDPQGQAIKAPGSLVVEAQEVTPEGLKRPLSSWQVPPQELRCRWQSGLITTGYYLILPWKVWPSTERLWVTARFQLVDGRVFQADKDVAIRILPPQQRRTLPPPAPAAPGPLPAPRPLLPKPLPDGPDKPQPDKPAPDKPEPKPILPPPLPPTGTPQNEGPVLLRGQLRPGSPVELLRPIPLGSED